MKINLALKLTTLYTPWGSPLPQQAICLDLDLVQLAHLVVLSLETPHFHYGTSYLLISVTSLFLLMILFDLTEPASS